MLLDKTLCSKVSELLVLNPSKMNQQIKCLCDKIKTKLNKYEKKLQLHQSQEPLKAKLEICNPLFKSCNEKQSVLNLDSTEKPENNSCKDIISDSDDSVHSNQIKDYSPKPFKKSKYFFFFFKFHLIRNFLINLTL